MQDEEGPATYSYISLNRRGLITDVREKVLISRLANTGAYGFPSAQKMLGEPRCAAGHRPPATCSPNPPPCRPLR